MLTINALKIIKQLHCIVKDSLNGNNKYKKEKNYLIERPLYK